MAMEEYLRYFMVTLLAASGCDASGGALSYVRVESTEGELSSAGLLISRKHVLTSSTRYNSQTFNELEFTHLNVRVECRNDDCGDNGRQFLPVVKAKFFRASNFVILTLSSVVNGHVPVASLTAFGPMEWSDREMQFTIWSSNGNDGDAAMKATYEVGRENCNLTKKGMECEFQGPCGASHNAGGVLSRGREVVGISSWIGFRPCSDAASPHVGFLAGLSVVSNEVKRWIEKTVQKDNSTSWHVSIINARDVSIGYGALIDRNHVLAAAALFYDRPVEAGTVDTRARIGDRIIGIHKVESHPEYDALHHKSKNNFAIVTLNEEVGPPDALAITVSAIGQLKSNNDHWLTAYVMENYPKSIDLTLLVARASRCRFIPTGKVRCLIPKLTCGFFDHGGILTEWKANQPTVVGVVDHLKNKKCLAAPPEPARPRFNPVTKDVLQWIETITNNM